MQDKHSKWPKKLSVVILFKFTDSTNAVLVTLRKWHNGVNVRHYFLIRHECYAVRLVKMSSVLS